MNGVPVAVRVLLLEQHLGDGESVLRRRHPEGGDVGDRRHAEGGVAGDSGDPGGEGDLGGGVEQVEDLKQIVGEGDDDQIGATGICGLIEERGEGLGSGGAEGRAVALDPAVADLRQGSSSTAGCEPAPSSRRPGTPPRTSGSRP